MAIQPPPEVSDAIASYDARTNGFRIADIGLAVEKSVKDLKCLSPEAKRGWWAEGAAFSFDTHETPNGGPWKTYFQPWGTFPQPDGTILCRPDLCQADVDVLGYWAARAKAAKHPMLVARYADLVWDATEFVTKAKRGKDKFEFALLAIDSYLAGTRIDDGSAWDDTRDNLGRALQLAMSIKDAERVSKVVRATIDYVERTAKDDHVSTYCYLFDNLLPSEKGPELTAEQEQAIITMFEAKFTGMTTPGGQWDVEPHSPRDIGLRLASYYERKGRLNEKTRVLRAVAEAFERRARIGDTLTGLIFLRDARTYFLQAGLREEAERIQRVAQKIGPEAEKQLAPIRVEHEIPKADVERFLDGMMDSGLEQALVRLAFNFIPDQEKIAKEMEEVAKSHPIYAMFSSRATKLGHGHIEADVGDDAGDPDGRMVHETAQRIQLGSFWIALTLERMIEEGLTVPRFLEFVRPCALFAENRLALIRRGIEAYFVGDYVQAIHVLIPQIERALVNLPPLVGKPSNKAHRTGRGVMQFKNLNDLLGKEDWPVSGSVGENLRMYLLATLAHPKGLNIRNDVCHGLWSLEQFTKIASERVLHVLLAVSMLRPQQGNDTASD